MLNINELTGGWYRDRTCDPYHVKVDACGYLTDNTVKFDVKGRVSFTIHSRETRPIPADRPLSPQNIGRRAIIEFCGAIDRVSFALCALNVSSILGNHGQNWRTA
jgi:hypothetical protein